jgi:hypothetical protein
MAEHLHDGPRVRPLSDEQGCRAVPKVVEPQWGELGLRSSRCSRLVTWLGSNGVPMLDLSTSP